MLNSNGLQKKFCTNCSQKLNLKNSSELIFTEENEAWRALPAIVTS